MQEDVQSSSIHVEATRNHANSVPMVFPHQLQGRGTLPPQCQDILNGLRKG